MSENKRFNAVINEDNEIEYIQDLQAYEDLDFADFFELANKLSEENEQLQQQNELLENTIESLTAQLAHGIEDVMGDVE